MWYDDPLFIKALKKPAYALKKLRRKGIHVVQDVQRSWRESSHLSDDIINDKEIRVVGLRRTGNHAIINWIRAQEKSEGKVKFINDIPLNENPYRHEYEYFIDHYPEYPKEIERLRQRVSGHFVKLACLIYNYEDYELSAIAHSTLEKKHDLYLGKSAKRYDVLILRDPFNLFASRMQRGFLSVKSSSKTFIDLWLSYAQEFLNETQYLNHSKVCVNYNLWASSIDYRQMIAEQLGLKFTDAGFDKVSKRGGGSSFDGQFQGSAQELQISERWKNYANNPTYRQLINNSEVLAYSNKIFGIVAGTELLQDSLQDIDVQS